MHLNAMKKCRLKYTWLLIPICILILYNRNYVEFLVARSWYNWVTLHSDSAVIQVNVVDVSVITNIAVEDSSEGKQILPEGYLGKLNLKLTSNEKLLELYELAYGIHTVFERCNLSYFLDWGSAIGAMRHGGITPWDEDLDITINEDNEAYFLGDVRNELMSQRVLNIRKAPPQAVYDYKIYRPLNSTNSSSDVYIIGFDNVTHKYTYKNPNLRLSWPVEFNASLMYPKLTNFGSFQMRLLPNRAYYYFDWYGASWMNIGMTPRWSHDADDNLIPMAFQIPRSLKRHAYAPNISMLNSEFSKYHIYKSERRCGYCRIFRKKVLPQYQKEKEVENNSSVTLPTHTNPIVPIVTQIVLTRMI